MRYVLVLFLPALALTPAIAAENCQIVGAEEVSFGVNRTIEGTCSNNGETIRCTLNNDDSVTCNGPAGTYTGYHKDTMIFSACGCSN
jgi:hypothetical protein